MCHWHTEKWTEKNFRNSQTNWNWWSLHFRTEEKMVLAQLGNLGEDNVGAGPHTLHQDDAQADHR